MKINTIPSQITYPRSGTGKLGWWDAYKRFLFSKQESIMLKIAPLALIGILPEEIITNVIPGLGLFDDAGFCILASVVVVRTLIRVNHYRAID